MHFCSLRLSLLRNKKVARENFVFGKLEEEDVSWIDVGKRWRNQEKRSPDWMREKMEQKWIEDFKFKLTHRTYCCHVLNECLWSVCFFHLFWWYTKEQKDQGKETNGGDSFSLCVECSAHHFYSCARSHRDCKRNQHFALQKVIHAWVRHILSSIA